MKTVLLVFICTSLAIKFCNADQNLDNALTAKGCNIDSVRKQSELVFKKLDKKRKVPDGYFKTEIFENDSLIQILRIATNGNIRNTGGAYVAISKATCKVTKFEIFQ
ncbi:hypothetical protein SAMN05518672_102608 [Chitinophaga sp. CF118]|uniref:hypothetical protein n=1 Tax=Chitinophaga sp. CF118 TaxID=1884367 RepID=UPI0008DF1759|nr:hypothetical protein [Chitinophaga sp. CF118]SFD61075.1 hypothetical protein SAMN05518672_102608 [Chitinophaga sp. CF118]